MVDLNMRVKGIGGSDVAAMLGLSPYKSPLQLWAEKVGRLAVDANPSIHLRFGQFVEPFVAQEYERQSGCFTVSHPEAIHHPKHDFMFGHIDRFVVDFEDSPAVVNGEVLANTILECKTANAFNKSEWGEPWSDEVPYPYLLQCIWYMAVSGCATTHLAVMLGNHDFRIYRIKRDLNIEAHVIERALRFWNEHVLTGIPPQPTNPSDVRILFPRERVGRRIEASTQVLADIEKLKALQVAEKQTANEIDQLKSRIQFAMADSEALCAGGQVIATFKSPKPTERIDTLAFKKAMPDIAKQFLVTSESSRRFLLKEAA